MEPTVGDLIDWLLTLDSNLPVLIDENAAEDCGLDADKVCEEFISLGLELSNMPSERMSEGQRGLLLEEFKRDRAPIEFLLEDRTPQ